MTTYEQAVQEGENRRKSSKAISKIKTSSSPTATSEGFDIAFHIARLTGLSEAEVTDRIKELGLEK